MGLPFGDCTLTLPMGACGPPMETLEQGYRGIPRVISDLAYGMVVYYQMYNNTHKNNIQCVFILKHKCVCIYVVGLLIYFYFCS